MTLRFQRCQRLCPVFPESRYWDVRHLGVHSSSWHCSFFSLTLTNCDSSTSLILLSNAIVHAVSVCHNLH
jgi:hypothetical protein